jgi:hypothetical protein
MRADRLSILLLLKPQMNAAQPFRPQPNRMTPHDCIRHDVFAKRHRSEDSHGAFFEAPSRPYQRDSFGF